MPIGTDVMSARSISSHHVFCHECSTANAQTAIAQTAAAAISFISSHPHLPPDLDKSAGKPFAFIDNALPPQTGNTLSLLLLSAFRSLLNCLRDAPQLFAEAKSRNIFCPIGVFIGITHSFPLHFGQQFFFNVQ
jgi:hypothetical protein